MPSASRSHRKVWPSTLTSLGKPAPGMVSSGSRSQTGTVARELVPAVPDLSAGGGTCTVSGPCWELIASSPGHVVSVMRGGPPAGGIASLPGRESSLAGRTSDSWVLCSSTLAVTLPDTLPSLVAAATARAAAGGLALTNRPLAPRTRPCLRAAARLPAAGSAPAPAAPPPAVPPPLSTSGRPAAEMSLLAAASALPMSSSGRLPGAGA